MMNTKLFINDIISFLAFRWYFFRLYVVKNSFVILIFLNAFSMCSPTHCLESVGRFIGRPADGSIEG